MALSVKSVMKLESPEKSNIVYKRLLILRKHLLRWLKK